MAILDRLLGCFCREVKYGSSRPRITTIIPRLVAVHSSEARNLTGSALGAIGPYVSASALDIEKTTNSHKLWCPDVPWKTPGGKTRFRAAKTPPNQISMDTYVAAETGQTVAQLRTVVEGSRVHGQPASDHVIVHFGKMYSKMQQDLQPIYLGQITAKQQMPVLQQDVQQIINQIQ
jgi:hypothetical protein